jgi:hypothetical protein
MECYICYDKETSTNKFVESPCNCKGSNKIHHTCLKTLIEKNGNQCSICKTNFKLNSKSHKIPENKIKENYKIPEKQENYIFENRIEHREYTYEDEEIIIKYSYIGNNKYRIDYKHKSICSIV